MAPRKKKAKRMVDEDEKHKEVKTPDEDGMFQGMVFYLVPHGIQLRRLQIWKQKLLQMGAAIDNSLSNKVTHILAVDSTKLLQDFNHDQLKFFQGRILQFGWLENSLKSGGKMPEEAYTVEPESEEKNATRTTLDTIYSQVTEEDSHSIETESLKFLDEEQKSDIQKKKIGEQNLSSSIHNKDAEFIAFRSSPIYYPTSTMLIETAFTVFEILVSKHRMTTIIASSVGTGKTSVTTTWKFVEVWPKHISCLAILRLSLFSETSVLYNPPDLNRNVTEIFGKLVNIYRALGDDRRSFSYYKAIPVIEKLPFKIESADQVKDLSTIGKSLKDHIYEILNTGKLSKLEHFETDEKVRIITLFKEVWGIGPATALKLYEKGHRTLDDLENEDSLTGAQRVGLRYFEDIRKRIPRNEVKEMEELLQKAGEMILPGVTVVCGGSYRRGKSSCGDMDIVITHPDGRSHKGFLPKYVDYLKEIKFLREDLVFSIHSIEGTDAGVDTYFGLCTYPGREQRYRIDLKVYPRDIYAFGLIAWTGNNVLNRRLRLLAESKGYKLDDTGLFLAKQTSVGKRGVKSPSLICRTEKEVFDVLGFPWLEPHERNL